MQKILIAFSALFALWTLAACASTDAAGGQSASANDCFNSEQANGFTVIDNTHIGLRVGANRNYVLTTMWNARDLDWTHAIALRSSTGRICTGNGLGVELIGGDPRRTYPIVSITRAAEDAAAPQGS
jgi:hypothetical protein